jgi:hypothetical protein
LVTAGEYLPGGGASADPAAPALGGCFVDVPPGLYTADIFGISWHAAPQWYSDGGVAPEAPADVVVTLGPRSGNCESHEGAPRFFDSFERWIFPDLSRRLGPEPGMLITTTVVRRREELILKPCGPPNYRPIIPLMNGLRWSQQVIVEVAQVNHETREFTAVLHGSA